MSRRFQPRLFTLIELLVVVAIITLLISILLPSLQGAREQGRRAVCLANLHSIVQAAAGYATEDRHDLIIPIHASMVTYAPAPDYWLRRTTMWFAFGGRSAPQGFRTDQGTQDLGDTTMWAARTRPLNRYMYRDIGAADAYEMKVFRCPSDRGYPDHRDVDDSPRENAARSCYDTLGNSYRASLYGVFPLRGEAYDGAFAVGPWGHRLANITEPARVAAFGEPMFFNMIGRDDGESNPDPVLATGWHRRWMTDSLAFCDGSARATLASGRQTVTAEVGVQMGVGNNWDLISRGPSWRFDLWPTPGARIWSQNPTDPRWNPGYMGQANERWKHWPFNGAEDNLRAE